MKIMVWQKRKNLIILVAWAASSLFVFVPFAAGAQADFNYDTKVTYRVDNGSATAVTETYTVTNNTARQYLSGLKLSTPADTLTGLAVKYGDGGDIPASNHEVAGSRGDFKFSSQEINITFPRQIAGSGKVWKFTVTYTATGLVDTKGSAHTVYVPSVEAGDANDTYSATVDVPTSFGTPHFPGAKSANGGTASGRQFYNFTKDELTQQALALAFGDSTIYNLNFNFPLNNQSPLPHTFTVTLPPDLNNQKSYINSLTPAPVATHLDADGNILADYKLQPYQKLTIQTDVSGKVNYLEYDMSASGKKTDIPADLVGQYTKGTHYWPTSGPVAAEAKKITDPNAPVINNVQAIYKDVIAKLTYNKDKIKFNIRQGADKALANPTNAVCLEYADLMIAMLRSQGIPAREPIGYAYSGDLKDSNAVADSLHAWVEAYVPGIGWMTFDPTWGEKFDGFGNSDLDHFAFAVWGENDSAPDAVVQGSHDINYQYENAVLKYKSTVTAVTASGQISGHRWIILPFLALDRVTVAAQPQIASDNNEVSIDGHLVQLGSLAPQQHTTATRLVVGGAWLKAANVSFTNGDVVLAATKLRPTASGMFVVIGLFILFAAAWWLMRRFGRKRVQILEEDMAPPKDPSTPKKQI